MPQLDVSTYIPQLFWLGVCFLALYFLMSKIVLPKITRFLEIREQGFEDKINIASTYREQAESLLAEYEGTLADARKEAQERYKSFTQSFSSEIEHKKKDFLDKVDEKIRRAEQDLYRARVEIGRDIRPASEDIAAVLLQKLTGRAIPLEPLPSKRKKG